MMRDVVGGGFRQEIGVTAARTLARNRTTRLVMSRNRFIHSSIHISHDLMPSYYMRGRIIYPCTQCIWLMTASPVSSHVPGEILFGCPRILLNLCVLQRVRVKLIPIHMDSARYICIQESPYLHRPVFMYARRSSILSLLMMLVFTIIHS